MSTNGWKKYRLDEIAAIQGGGTPNRSVASYFGGDIPWVTPTDLPKIGIVIELNLTKENITETGLSSSSAKIIPAGSILFSSRASIGKIAITNKVCATNQGFVNFTPNKDMVDNWFLAFLLRRYTPEITELAGKTTFLEVPRGKLKGFTIVLPPLDEQRRIVASIKDCIERIKEIEENCSEIALEVEALFPAILNERFAEILSSQKARPLEDVADIRGGGSLPKGVTDDAGQATILLVKVGDMNADGNERLISTAREFLPRAEAGRGVIESGAVIFPKRGGAIATNKKRLLGRSALIDPNLMAVVAKPNVLHSEYLYYWCLTLDLSKLSNGGVIPQLNRKDLAPLEIPVPSMADQMQLVEDLKRAEVYCTQLKSEFTDAQSERGQLRQSILRKAFAGEL